MSEQTEQISYVSFGIVYQRRKRSIRILLVQEHGKKGSLWKLAGGKSELDDACDPLQTLVRELKEKFALRIDIRIIGPRIIHMPLEDHTFSAYPIAVGKRHGPYVNSQKVHKIRWFHTAEIERLLIDNCILPHHTQALTRFLQNHI